MAILSALLAWLGRELSTLIQAVLGWSVLALFGRLSSAKQTALAVTLLVSLMWTLAVAGVFVPAVSAWAFAFAPVHKWVEPGLVRWITLGLAVLLPLGVGAVTRWVAPVKAPLSTTRALLSGYPLTLGYAIACIVTAVTVPIVRLASVVRGWADEHVYVQPRPGEYDDVLRELVAACEAAGSEARVEPVPGRMLIATRLLKWFARSALDPIMPEDPKMIRATDVELHLYPADLLLRGKQKKVARVRATMMRTWLERYAFTVEDPVAQKLQDELQRMWHVVQRHHRPSELGATAFSRLREIAHDLDRASMPFDEWVALDRNLHRLERAMESGRDVLKDDIAVQSLGDGGEKQENTMVDRDPKSHGNALPPSATLVPDASLAAAPTGDLLRDVVSGTRELVRLEVALARDDIRREVAESKIGGMALGAATAALLSSITMFLVAIALAFAESWLAALVVGVIMLVASGALGYAGYRAMPKKPLAATRERLESDLKQLKERVA